MKKPTKKSFYEYMSLKFNRKYRDSDGYLTLIDVIQEAQDESKFMDLAELTLMSKADRLIYRMAIVEYGLEYIT